MFDNVGLAESAPVRVPIGGEDGDRKIASLPSNGGGSPKISSVQTFQSLVGSLLWIDRCTRPNIAVAVNQDARCSYAPTQGDGRLAEKIAKYLWQERFLVHDARRQDYNGKDGVRVEVYRGTDYPAEKTDRK